MIGSAYNNPAICAASILSVLSHSKELTLAKAILIMPLVMHDSTVRYLGRSNVAFREVSGLVAVRPDLFANFNERYFSSLVTSVNAIQWLVAAGYVEFDGVVKLVASLKTGPELGDRAARIAKASGHISALLNSSAEELYLNFRVKL
ncbi:DUF6521 family protein [Stenotrophomonas rhizophila]|uniref:three component ABC system middle component n=1 Tax=Stenotrophomonas rhizophila TaxID=216778 RepID=UPI00224AC7BF|nr:three component ABC system middle component [Stenotrophomonas rhizophila]MCX2919785.1 DUF6521 family protein [Stenotrophomonas rhizophila]